MDVCYSHTYFVVCDCKIRQRDSCDIFSLSENTLVTTPELICVFTEDIIVRPDFDFGAQSIS